MRLNKHSRAHTDLRKHGNSQSRTNWTHECGKDTVKKSELITRRDLAFWARPSHTAVLIFNQFAVRSAADRPRPPTHW